MLMFKIKKNIILKYFKIKNIFKKHNPPHSKKKKKHLNYSLQILWSHGDFFDFVGYNLFFYFF